MAYELAGFTGVFGRMVEGVRGAWIFTADGHASIVRGPWESKQRPRYGVLLRRVVVPPYSHHMQQIVDRSVVAAERIAGLDRVR